MEDKPIKSLEELANEEFGMVPFAGEEPPNPGKKSKKDDKDYSIQTSFFETPKYIFEQIRMTEEDNEGLGGVRFARYTKKTEEVTIVQNFEYEGKLYVPINNEVVREGGILLPSEAKEYDSDKKLIEEITGFLFQYFEPPDDFWRSILPYLILFYWLSDKFPFVPYLHFVGLTGTGKSTALISMGEICYKAINASGAISMASIFRIAHEWRGTLLMDEFELSGQSSDTYKQMVQLLKAGVSDMPVYRVEGEGKKTYQMYKVKSPRIFSSQEPLTDAALQSRTLVVRMKKNNKAVPLYRLPKFHQDAQKIRNKLLLWRLRHLNKIDLSDIEFGFPELKKFDGRVQQVVTPIYYLSSTDAKKMILKFAKEHEEETKRERLDEIEGQIFIYIRENYLKEVPLKELTDHLNKVREGQGYKTNYSERRVGNLVRKALGFDTERKTDGYYVVLDFNKILALCDYYGLEAVKAPEEADLQIKTAEEIFNK